MAATYCGLDKRRRIICENCAGAHAIKIFQNNARIIAIHVAIFYLNQS